LDGSVKGLAAARAWWRPAGTWLLAAAAVIAAGCSGNQSMFNPQGPPARSIANLGTMLLVLCGVVYVVTMLALGWALIRRRHVRDDLPETTRALTRTVTIAVAVTAVILVGLGVISFAADRGLTTPSGPGAIQVEVVGHQWWWDFRYTDVTPSDYVDSPNELHIPVGVPVVLKVSSQDVIHSFWVPNLHGKRDLIPGQITHTWIQADTAGVYRGQCAEFCGHQHAHMSFNVVAEPMSAFLQWIAHQRQPASEPQTDEQRRGRDVFLQTTCVTCHTVRGTDAGSRAGPELTHVGSRLTIAAGTLPNVRGHLAGWIANPQTIKPGVRMPANPLQSDDLQAVLSYVRSLR
jgi:cytochrome c oxidase subunit 2